MISDIAKIEFTSEQDLQSDSFIFKATLEMKNEISLSSFQMAKDDVEKGINKTSKRIEELLTMKFRDVLKKELKNEILLEWMVKNVNKTITPKDIKKINSKLLVKLTEKGLKF